MITSKLRRRSVLAPMPPTFPQFLELTAFTVRAPISAEVASVNAFKGVVGSGLALTAIALFVVESTTPVSAGSVGPLISTAAAVQGAIMAFHLVPAGRIGTALRASDIASVSIFWLSSLSSAATGLIGAFLLAATAPGLVQAWLGADRIAPALLVALSLTATAISLGLLFIGIQGRFTRYIGVTSFRRGSAFLPSVVLCIVATGYLAAAFLLAVHTGVIATTVLATTVIAITSASFKFIKDAHRSIQESKQLLISSIDDLQVALLGDDEAAVRRCALAFNQRYSGRTALRHPLVTASVREALDIVVARAIDVGFWELPQFQPPLSAVVRGLSASAARIVLAEGCAMIRAHLVTTG